MSEAKLSLVDKTINKIQLVTFVVGEVALGVDIACVQEINRNLDITRVPGASAMIHGVVNLRGDVVTVLNPHRVFGLERIGDPERARNLILNVAGERVGVVVDRISDILTVPVTELSRRPSNMRQIDRRFIDSVCLQEKEVVVVLNATALLDFVNQPVEIPSAVA